MLGHRDTDRDQTLNVNKPLNAFNKHRMHERRSPEDYFMNKAKHPYHKTNYQTSLLFTETNATVDLKKNHQTKVCSLLNIGLD